MRLKIIKTTDGKFRGRIIEIDTLEDLLSKVQDELKIEMDNYIMDTSYMKVHNVNYTIFLKEVN